MKTQKLPKLTEWSANGAGSYVVKGIDQDGNGFFAVVRFVGDDATVSGNFKTTALSIEQATRRALGMPEKVEAAR